MTNPYEKVRESYGDEIADLVFSVSRNKLMAVLERLRDMPKQYKERNAGHIFAESMQEALQAMPLGDEIFSILFPNTGSTQKVNKVMRQTADLLSDFDRMRYDASMSTKAGVFRVRADKKAASSTAPTGGFAKAVAAEETGEGAQSKHPNPRYTKMTVNPRGGSGGRPEDPTA